MLVVGGMMLFGKTPTPCPRGANSWLITLLGGAGVGALTGFLGVGGGFLIVPALVMLVGMPIHQAVGTSLIVIAMNSLAGLLGHLEVGAMDMSVVAIFVVAGLAGVFSGTRLTRILRPDHLRAGFALFVMLLGAALLVDNLGKLI
jgi:uncharacterized membrane protein YfcA